MTFEICSSPISVSCNILGVWLTLQSVVLLDSAFCNCSQRLQLLQLMEAREFVLHDSVTLPNIRLLAWLKQRSMKVSNVTITGTLPSHELLYYITEFGNALRGVNFDRVVNVSDTMFLIASYCKKIKVVRCSGAALPHAFPALLVNNPNITEIKVDILYPVVIQTDHVYLPNLETLSVIAMECNMGFPWSLVRNNSSIARLECVGLPHLSFNDTDRPTQNSITLRSLSLKWSSVAHAKAVGFLSPCSNLLNLDLSHSHKINDDTILYVAQHLLNLRTLSIQHCLGTTDLCLAHIAEHCGDRLKILYADIRNPTVPMTELIVQTFSEKCIVLNHFNVNTTTALCSGSCAFSLIQGCAAMTTLEANRIGSTARNFATLVRPALTIVVTDGKTKPYDVLTLPI